MFAKLGGIFQGWLGIPLKTGLIFWLGGFFLWLFTIINWDAIDKLRFNKTLADKERYVVKEWVGIWDFLRNIQESELVLFILILVSLILLSGVLVKTVQFKLLRLCEGYGWFNILLEWRIEYYEKQYVQDLARWKILEKKLSTSSLNLLENREYAGLDRKMVLAPAASLRMPTRLGNILRGYEQRPYEKYGLDSIICWSRLWLVLPESIQKELSAARDALDETIQIIAWGILFFIWTSLSWFALPIALFLIGWGYHLALDAAEIYGQLIEATFDMYRHLLYKALNRELPKDSEAERVAGLELTRYLWRGGSNPNASKDTKLILPK